MENCEVKIKVPTTSVFDFPRLILGGEGKYVDKTDLLYQLDFLPVFHVGVNYDPEKRGIDDPLVEAQRQ